MESVDLFATHQWELLGAGYPFFHVEAMTIIYTWIVLGIILCAALTARIVLLWYPTSAVGYVIKAAVRFCISSIEDSCKSVALQRYITFFGTLTIFLLACNWLMVIPTIEEPTRDLNTTLGLSLITFLFVQLEAIRRHGVLRYLNELFKTPFALSGVYDSWSLYTIIMLTLRCIANCILGTIMLPLELLGKLSGIMSLAFRLFGNILAGSIIASIWLQFRSGSFFLQLFGIPLTLLITVFFGLFEGAVQACVFVMLSLSALGRALRQQE